MTTKEASLRSKVYAQDRMESSFAGLKLKRVWLRPITSGHVPGQKRCNLYSENTTQMASDLTPAFLDVKRTESQLRPEQRPLLLGLQRLLLRSHHSRNSSGYIDPQGLALTQPLLSFDLPLQSKVLLWRAALCSID